MSRSSRKTNRPVARASAQGAPSAVHEWFARSHGILVGAMVALIVATALIGGEGAVWQGTHVVLIMGWLLLTLAWLGRLLLEPHSRWHISLTGGAVLVFLLMHSASALVMLHAGQPRLTLNALWLWVSFGLLFLAVRQLLRSGVEQRALCGVVLALGAALAVLGFYQVGYSNPKLRAQYAANPEQMLREQGEYLPPGSPQRAQFENRLASLEPIGPFALTNSLAGFLGTLPGTDRGTGDPAAACHTSWLVGRDGDDADAPGRRRLPAVDEESSCLCGVRRRSASTGIDAGNGRVASVLEVDCRCRDRRWL